MIDLEELEKLLAEATPGPWMLATSNSWRRIVSVRHTPVCEPIVQNDGHPDLYFRNGGPNGPDAALIVAAANALPELIAMARRVEELDRIERNRDMWKGQCERQAERLTVLNRAVSEISRGVQSGVDPQVSIDRLVKIARSAAEPVADTEAPTTEGTALKEKPQ